MDKLTISTLEKQLLACIMEDESKINLFKENCFITSVGIDFFNAFKDTIAKELSLSNDNILKAVRVYDNGIDKTHIESLKEADFKMCEFDTYLRDLTSSFYSKKFNDEILDKAFITSGKKEVSLDDMREVQEAMNFAMSQIDKTSDIYQLLNAEEEMDAIEEQVENRYKGIDIHSSGCIYLDKLLHNNSLNGGELSIVTASSGSGKTSYVTWLVEQRRWKNLPTLAVNLEMSFDAVMTNKMAIRSKLNKDKFSFPDEDSKADHYAEIKEAIAKERLKTKRMKKYKYLDTPSLNIEQLIYFIKRSKKEMGLAEKDYMLCVVDLATMIQDFNSGKGGSKANDYEHAVNKLLEVAKLLNVHILQVVQIKRPKDKVDIKEASDADKLAPHIEELKNSGALEERARLVMSVFRRKFFLDRYLGKDHPLSLLELDIMQVKILKQNGGAIGTHVNYLFHPTIDLLIKYDEPEIEVLEDIDDN